MPTLQQILLTDSFAEWVDKTNLAVVELNSLSGSSLEVISLNIGTLVADQLLAYDGADFVNVSNVNVLGTLDVQSTLDVVGVITGTTNINITSGEYQIGGVSKLTSTTLGSAVVNSSLTSVGTIATGVWQGTTVDELYGGTGFSTYTTGDLLYSSATNVLSKLGVGTNGLFLTVTAGVPVWGTAPSATPGGSPTEIQFNTGGAFAADPGLTYVAGASDTLSVGVAATSAGAVDLLFSGAYKINGTTVLSATALGSAIVSSSLTTVGTLSSGTWNGTTISGQYGGTGTNNSGKTITLSGNFATSGAFTTTLTVTGNSNVTLPTTGTLITSTVATLSSLTSVGTIGTGTWQGTTLALGYGGTGQTTANASFNALAPSQATHSGKLLTTNGTNTSWAVVGSSPGGSDTQVQFNNGGTLDGHANFTWSDTKLYANHDAAATNTVLHALQVSRTSSAAPAIGIGAGIEFLVETAAANYEVGATIEAVTTTVTAASEVFNLEFKTMSGGAAATTGMTLTGENRLGINITPNAGTNLHVAGNTWLDGDLYVDTAPGANTNTLFVDVSSDYIRTPKLGVGTNPGTTFHVSGTSFLDGDLYVDNVPGASSNTLFVDTVTDYIRTPKIGVGKFPSYPLDVSGNARVDSLGVGTNPNGTAGRIDCDDIFLTGGVDATGSVTASAGFFANNYSVSTSGISHSGTTGLIISGASAKISASGGSALFACRGTDGLASFSGVVTNITIVGGIVTAAS